MTLLLTTNYEKVVVIGTAPGCYQRWAGTKGVYSMVH